MAKILIIKLGYSETLDQEIGRTSSLGDVLRTTVILDHFKNDHVSWLVDEKAFPLLDGNKHISRILLFDLSTVLQLQKERFDTVINFEKVPGICALADSISAWRRFGFRFDEVNGNAQSYDRSEKVFSICHDINKKREYKGCWQKFLIEMIGGEWREQEYILGYQSTSKIECDVGLNYKVGSKWPNKAWAKENWDKLSKILQQNNYSISWQEGLKDIYQYIDWINKCKIIISSDSLGFHIALALKKGVVVIHGPTNANETFMYNRGESIYPKNFDCAPCFKAICDKEKECIDTIMPEEVYLIFLKLYNSLHKI